MSEDIFSFIRLEKIQNVAYLHGQTAHAKRTGPNIEIRPGAVPCTQAVSSLYSEDPRDYYQAFKLLKMETGARERQSAPLGLHVICAVSPGWVQETGDLHDPENPRNKLLLETAKKSVEKRFGSVFASRMDYDEIGGAVVDVFCMPVHERSGRPKKDGSRGPSVVEISVNKSLKALQTEFGTKLAYIAVQDAWAMDVGQLDRRIKRGKPKSETGREHLSVPDYKAAKDEADRIRAEGETQRRLLAVRQIEIDSEERRLKERKAELAAKDAKLYERTVELAAKDAKLQEQYEKVCDAQVANFNWGCELGDEENRIERNRKKVEAREEELLERERAITAKDNWIRLKQDEMRTREQQLDQGWREVEHLASYHEAFKAGLAKINQGAIRAAGDIDLDPSLAPAKTGLAMITDVIAKRTLDIRRAVTERLKSLDGREKKLKETEGVAERREAEAAEKIRAVASLGPALQQLFSMLRQFKFQGANIAIIDRARSIYEKAFNVPQQKSTGIEL